MSKSPLNSNCIQTLAGQLGIFADWCLFVSIKWKIKNCSKYAQKLFTKPVYMQCESFPPWDTDIAIGPPRRMTPVGPIGFVSDFFFFQVGAHSCICLSPSPAFYDSQEWVSYCVWLSGSAFLINAVGESLKRNLHVRASISDKMQISPH